MQKFGLGLLLALLALGVSPGEPQQNGSTSLMVRVEPEARVEPQQIQLHFQVSPGTGSEIVTQAAAIAAWARSTPGRAIRLTARLTDLQGPAGRVPANAVRWTGAVVNAAGGAQRAACSSGTFSQGAAQDLVQGWDRSGKLTCMVDFELSAAATLPPGEYSGLVSLALGQR